MFKSLSAGVVVALLASTAAFAADLPSRKQAPVAPVVYAPVFSWTGAYVGVNAGYGFGKITKSGTYFEDPKGFSGGGQIGYNYQLPNRIVIGAETDIQYADMRSKVNGTGIAGGLNPATKNGIEYFGTVRPRVGYAMDRALIYVTGGLAYGNQKLTVPGVGSGSSTNLGWTAGAGVEYAFTTNITGKVEGLYVNLDSHNYVASTPVSTKSGTEFGVARAGVNYKF
jgi:outer membrane immunogenic protein